MSSSGAVAQLGDGVDDVAIGDAVYALTPFDRDGVAADYAVVATELLAPKPRALSHVEAAAVPLPALTAWQGLFDHGRLAAGERVLIHGATGGVGQYATQLAKRHGAHVIATVSTRGLEQARELGADEVVDHTATPFEAAIEPVDVVFDTAGGDRLARSPSVLRPGGRLVSVAEEIAGAVYFVVEPSREQLREITALVQRHDMKPTIDSVYPLDNARAAFERTMAGDARGKVVLRVE